MDIAEVQIHLSVAFTVVKIEDEYVAHSQAVDLSVCGKTEDEAKSNFVRTLDAIVRDQVSEKKINAVLKSLEM
jgi:hypothetical protein